MTQDERKSRAPWTARRIHLWVSVLLALPMVLMAVSGTLISMRSITDVKVPASWMSAETVPERLPPSAYLESPGGTAWIGNAQGLYRVSAEGAAPVPQFSGQEVVALAALPGRATPLVATRMAVWAEVDGAWQAVRRGRVRQLSMLPDGRVLAIAGGRGELADGKPFVTPDGTDWQPYRPALKALATLPRLDQPKVALHQWMRELHGGAFLFGKGPGEMAWSTTIGVVLVLLALTGLWMWWRREQRRAMERLAAHGRALQEPNALGVRGA